MTRIADRLGYPVNTVRMWRKRGRLPEPIAELTIGPVWSIEQIDEWAEHTGRLRND